MHVLVCRDIVYILRCLDTSLYTSKSNGKENKGTSFIIVELKVSLPSLYRDAQNYNRKHVYHERKINCLDLNLGSANVIVV